MGFLTNSNLEDFDLDVNVSVFETTIRVLGGLLSAHIMITDNATIIQRYNLHHPENRTKWLFS